MLGIPEGSAITLEYCCKLMMEYTVLDSAQLYILLKRFSPYGRKKRLQFCRALCHTQYARQIECGGRNYFVLRPGIKIQGRIKQQVSCFWVLLDYIDKVDRHFATGTPGSLISMEIEGRDYSILYAQLGKEKMCSYLMEQSGLTRYFIVVENLAQIPLIKGGQIHAFVLLDEKNTLHYYSGTGG